MKSISCFLLVALVFFGGCASVGTKMDSSSLAQIEKGVSTREDVERLFGKPSFVGLGSDGKVTLGYIYSEARNRAVNFVPIVGMVAGGMDTHMQQLQFVIDENEVVENFVWNDTTGEVNTGLFR